MTCATTGRGFVHGDRFVADKFDPYRESLVMETTTVWPAEFDEMATAQKSQIAEALHNEPESCANLEYVRMHTGFCRQITGTEEDVDRVS